MLCKRNFYEIICLVTRAIYMHQKNKRAVANSQFMVLHIVYFISTCMDTDKLKQN